MARDFDGSIETAITQLDRRATPRVSSDDFIPIPLTPTFDYCPAAYMAWLESLCVNPPIL